VSRCPTCDGRIADGFSVFDHERFASALVALRRGSELLASADAEYALGPALEFAEGEVLATLDDATLDAAEVARAHTPQADITVLTRIEWEVTWADMADDEGARLHLRRIFAIARGMDPEPFTDPNGQVWT